MGWDRERTTLSRRRNLTVLDLKDIRNAGALKDRFEKRLSKTSPPQVTAAKALTPGGRVRNKTRRLGWITPIPADWKEILRYHLGEMIEGGRYGRRCGESVSLPGLTDGSGVDGAAIG
jgi:hypothetical protein